MIARARKGALRTPLRAISTGLLALSAATALTACAGLSKATTNGVQVVAAESFWGSVAAQIGGPHAGVQSIITNPAEDPHSYEPTANDARVLATSQLAIVNGVGYDPWASKLLSANPDPARITLDVGRLFGLHEGDNPHRWYDPPEVVQVARTIEQDLVRLDPHNAAYYAHRELAFETSGLARYDQVIARIKRRYTGVPVGASESIFALQAPALGLDLITSASFMKATSEGTDVGAQDAITTQEQITRHEIKVWIYNTQNATPAIQRLNALARANHIPTASITETLTPAKASFEQWQVAQLQEIERALHEATGR